MMVHVIQDVERREMKNLPVYIIQALKFLLMIIAYPLKYIRILIIKLWKDPAFLIAVITAYVLIQQNGLLSGEIALLEQDVKYEQKPIVNLMLGYANMTTIEAGSLLSARSVMNIGKLPAYNINLRWATRTTEEYPYEHFEQGMEDDSLYFNILFPGIPWLDDQRISFNTNVDYLSVKDMAITMFQENMVFYVHYWLEYQDISGRQYVLQETISLQGSNDSTIVCGQTFARDIEYGY